MNEHPIIFSTDMVKAILEGRKTMTRRVIKPQPVKGDLHDWEWNPGGMACSDDYFRERAPYHCPYGQVGDRLWLRERHRLTATPSLSDVFYVKCEYSDGEVRYFEWTKIPKRQQRLLKKIRTWGKWRSGRYMYKFTHRFDYDITELRVERLQEIPLDELIDEGIEIPDELMDLPDHKGKYLAIQQLFIDLWDKFNAKRGYGWDANPWVWVIGFKRNGNGNQAQ